VTIDIDDLQIGFRYLSLATSFGFRYLSLGDELRLPVSLARRRTSWPARSIRCCVGVPHTNAGFPRRWWPWTTISEYGSCNPGAPPELGAEGHLTGRYDDRARIWERAKLSVHGLAEFLKASERRWPRFDPQASWELIE
jgi:hypothetical protein